MKLLLTIAIVLGGMNIAHGQVTCDANSCTGPAIELMSGIFPRPVGGVLLDVGASVISQLPCNGAASGNNIVLEDTHSSFKETYATLLTASVAEKSVQLRIDTAESDCTLFFARMFN